MSWIQKLFAPSVKKAVTPQQMNIMLGAGLPIYNNSDSTANVNAYATSDDVYSIVRRIARTAAMIERKVYVVKNDKAFKRWELHKKGVRKWNTKELTKSLVLKELAMEEVSETHPLNLLLKNPNPELAATSFYEGIYTSKLTTGNVFIWMPKVEFGVNAGKPTELWMLPSQFMSLSVTDKFPRRVERYNLLLAGMSSFGVDEVLHLKYFNPLYDYTGGELYGLSPISAGSKIITRQAAETDYLVNSFQNSGISGIVYNESVMSDEVSPEVLGKLKSDFYSEGSGIHNARKLLFQAGKIGYTNIGLSPIDMNILESEKKTFKKLCNLFGVSDRLFNNDASGSEISVDIAYKDLYTNAVLPEVYSLDDALNQYLAPLYKEKLVIASDITEIAELQDDLKDMAAVFSSLPIMNPNVIASAYGWPVEETDEMKAWYIRSGYTKMTDMADFEEPDISDYGEDK